MDENLYILAKNNQEFKYFCFVNGLNPGSRFIHYIIDAQRQLQGTKEPRVVYYGRYHERKDYLEIAAMLRARQSVDVTSQYVNEVSKY
jgi:hypothetical protein